MTIINPNGIQYDIPADMLADGGTGYSEAVTAGTGDVLPEIYAVMADYLAAAAKYLRTTSASSVVIGSGSKTFVLAADLPYQVGERVLAVDAANAANFMYGTVASYTSATKTLVLTVASADTGGSGTITAWNIAAVGQKGDTGATGASGAGGFQYIASTGSANAYVLTYSPSIGSYSVGQPLEFKANFTNTGAATANANGIGAKAITLNGAALIGGEIISGQIYTLFYDGTNLQLAGVASSKSGIYTASVVASSGAAQTLNFAASNYFDITLDSACTLTFTQPTVATSTAYEGIVVLRQNGTGGYVTTFPGSSVVEFSGTPAPTIPPSLNVNANSVTVLRLKKAIGATKMLLTVEGTNVGSSNGNVAVAGLYLVGGEGMKANKSSDGTTFLASSPTFSGGTYPIIDIKYNPIYSKFILLGKPSAIDTIAHCLLVTTNGSSYSSPSSDDPGTGGGDVPTIATNKVFIFSNGNMITSQQESGNQKAAFSTDGGVNFNQKTTLSGSAVAIGSGWVGIANSGLLCQVNAATFCYTTDGGVNITGSQTHTGVTNAKAAAYLNGNYVVGGQTGNLGYKTLVSATALTTISSNLASEDFLGGIWTGTNYVVFTATSLSTATTIAGTYTSRTTAFFTTAAMTGNIVAMANNGATVIAVTDTGDIGRSTDSGVTWAKLSNGNNPQHGTQIRGVGYFDSNFWVWGDAGAVQYSTDGIAFTAITTTGFGANAVLCFLGI